MRELGDEIWYKCRWIVRLRVVCVVMAKSMFFALSGALYSIHSKQGFGTVWAVSQSRGREYLDGTVGAKILYFPQE